MREKGFPRRRLALAVAAAACLAAASCASHKELKSPCVVAAGGAVSPDCVFTPINGAAA